MLHLVKKKQKKICVTKKKKKKKKLSISIYDICMYVCLS